MLAALVGSSQAQLVQNSSSICSWGQLRGAVAFLWKFMQMITFAANILRDTVYLDGGELWKQM